jgi:predicted lipid-binding transport protein (Tim44 family)
MGSNFVRNLWILLRKAAQVAIAALIAAAWLAAPIRAHALQLSSPALDRLKPSRTASVNAATGPVRDSSAVTLDTRMPAPQSATVSNQAASWWLIAAVLGASLLGSAGWGWRMLAAHRFAQKRQSRRHVSSGSAHSVRGKTYEQELLGVETWLPSAPKLTPSRLMATQPVRPVPGAFTGAATSSLPPAVPRDFDAAAFERDAKVLFMRMTTAWDAQDHQELRRLIAPHAFDTLVHAIALEVKGAGAVNILTLEAQVLRIAMQSVPATAEVRFFGMYRGESSPAAGRFDCVWSLVDDDGHWRITGIQSL